MSSQPAELSVASGHRRELLARAIHRGADGPGNLTLPPARWFRGGLLVTLGLVVLVVAAAGTPFSPETPGIVVASWAVLLTLARWSRLRLIAWLLLWAASFTAAGIIVLRQSDQATALAELPVHVGLVSVAVGLVVLVGTLFAAEPGRRLGRWVLPAGIGLTVWVIAGGLAFAASASASATDDPWFTPWWGGLALLPMRELPLLVLAVFGPLLLGLVGQSRDPWRRARRRVRREGASAKRWPGIFIDELVPGREAGRQAAAQAERARFAADVHAEVLPSLNLALAESAAGASPERIADRLRELEHEVRGLVNERRFVVLEEFGIVEALEWLAERAEDRSSVAVEIAVGPATTEGRPPREVERGAFRVAQLAIDNALLHAQSHRIAIEVQSEPRRLRLRVEDDGRGMTLGDETRSGGDDHRGIADMRLQAELVHARLDISTVRPGGTLVLFDWAAS